MILTWEETEAWKGTKDRSLGGRNMEGTKGRSMGGGTGMSLGVGRSSSNQGCCRGLGGLGSAHNWSHLGRVQETGRVHLIIFLDLVIDFILNVSSSICFPFLFEHFKLLHIEI